MMPPSTVSYTQEICPDRIADPDESIDRFWAEHDTSSPTDGTGASTAALCHVLSVNRCDNNQINIPITAYKI